MRERPRGLVGMNEDSLRWNGNHVMNQMKKDDEYE